MNEQKWFDSRMLKSFLIYMIFQNICENVVTMISFSNRFLQQGITGRNGYEFDIQQDVHSWK